MVYTSHISWPFVYILGTSSQRPLFNGPVLNILCIQTVLVVVTLVRLGAWSWQRDSPVGCGLLRLGLRHGPSLSLDLGHHRFGRHRGLWFSDRTSFIHYWSPLVQTVSAWSRAHVTLRRLLLWLWLLLCHSVGHRAALDRTRSVLIWDGMSGAEGVSVGGGELRVVLRFLVAALGAALDGGRLLEGEVGAIGLGLGAARPAFEGGRGLDAGDVLLWVARLSRGTRLPVALQTNTKYTLTGKFIHSRQGVIFAQTIKNINISYSRFTQIKRTDRSSLWKCSALHLH